MLTTMIAVMPAHATAPPFNPTLYATAATIIPVLFVAIALQGDTYKAVIRAAAKLVPAIGTNARGLAPVLLAVATIPGLAVWGETTAILVLAWGHAGVTSYRFVLAVVIFLTAVAALGPLGEFGRFAINAMRESPAPESGCASSSADPPAAAGETAPS